MKSILILALLLSLAACGNGDKTGPEVSPGVQNKNDNFQLSGEVQQ